MPKFDDFMNAFQYNPDVFDAEQFKAASLAAWQEDITGVTAVVEAKDAAIAERDQKLKDLGLANWNLLMKQGPPVPADDQTSRLPGHQEPTEPRSIDSFFGTPKQE